MQDSADHQPAARRNPTGGGAAGGGAAGGAGAGLTLLFREGARSDLALIERSDLACALVGRPAGQGDPAELLMAGLGFRLFGLAPGPAVRAAAPRHGFDVMLPTLARTEAARVLPADAATATTPPVLRALVALGCELAALPGLVGLGWEPAGTVMSPAYYLRVMQVWLRGGAFPGLGLAALVRDAEAMRSEGLALFAGHELVVSLDAGGSPAGAAKLAVRAMHALVETGISRGELADHLGLAGLPCAFSPDDGLLRIG